MNRPIFLRGITSVEHFQWPEKVQITAISVHVVGSTALAALMMSPSMFRHALELRRTPMVTTVPSELNMRYRFCRTFDCVVELLDLAMRRSPLITACSLSQPNVDILFLGALRVVPRYQCRLSEGPFS